MVKKNINPFLLYGKITIMKYLIPKVNLLKKLNITRGLVKHWLHRCSYSYTKYGIKEIDYCNK